MNGDDLLSLFADMQNQSQPKPAEQPEPPVPATAALDPTPRCEKAASTLKVKTKKKTKTSAPEHPDHISTIDISEEMRTSFLEYAYSVIYARALPDARDGLKPVQRRILYMMDQMGLKPEKGHVKSSSVVGEVMGKLHPHGDSAIYEALVRLAQEFNLRVPVVDGHGNFGSLDDGPAASRYTEVRQAAPALDMVQNLKEEVVDFIPNYDNRLLQPEVLPAGFPNLLVNGTTGIAVGMATNIPPHNLRETINGAIYLLHNPQAEVEELMRFIPGPDLPGGGEIIGLEGVREAYRSGRGSFKTRAKCSIERVTARKQGILVTELPYMVGPEKVIEKIKEGVSKGRLQGISNVTNLTDRDHDLRLVIEVKNGFNPQAVLNTLFKHTPMESTFGINAVALVHGQPQTLGLKEMLQVFLDHRMEIVLRRSIFRLGKRQERLHLVEGLLVAVLDIDDVISIIRSSDEVSQAKARLIEAFDLDEIQAEHILSLQLRRLTRLARIELEAERDDLLAQIAELKQLVEDEQMRKDLVAAELTEVSERHADPRRTVLKETDTADSVISSDIELEVADDPCMLVLGADGLLARFNTAESLPTFGPRVPSDGIATVLSTTARATVGAICQDGQIRKLNVIDTPALTVPAEAPSLSGGVPIDKLLGIASDNRVLALVSLEAESDSWWVATAQGTVKKIRVEVPTTLDIFEIISLPPGDYLVGAGSAKENSDFILVTAAGQLLRTPADKVRAQGRSASGVAGMKLATGDQVIAAACVSYDYLDDHVLVSVAGKSMPDNQTLQTSVKVSPITIYPVKGRSGQGVRCQRLLKGEDRLVLAAITMLPVRANNRNNQPVTLPELDQRRDASGTALKHQIDSIG